MKRYETIFRDDYQSWMFIGRIDAEAEAEAAILWPPDVKSRLIGKDPVSGKDWRQEEKGTTEEDMVGWHHCLDGHEFEQALGSLVYCSPWGRKESAMTEQLNWTELKSSSFFHIIINIVFYFISNSKYHYWDMSILILYPFIKLCWLTSASDYLVIHWYCF